MAERSIRLEEYLHDAAERPISERPALVIQGGGLRAVYAMGALATLEERGLSDSFSFVIAGSAGAMNGAYFLAGQAAEGVTVYTDAISNRQFCDPTRRTKRVDIDFLVDIAMKRQHPLDTYRVLRSETPLLTSLTEADTAQSIYVSSRDYQGDLYELLRASAALPILYDKKIHIDGRAYIDGGVSVQVPFEEATTLGAKEILVILTRTSGHRKHDQHPMLQKLAQKLISSQSPAVLSKILGADHEYNNMMEMFETESVAQDTKAWVIQPSDPKKLVGRTTTNRDKLRRTAALAQADTLRVLSRVVTIAS